MFGDGSVMIVFTPGHTPGHESLLVHMKKTGWILLSGDAVHLQTNWDNRESPILPPCQSNRNSRHTSRCSAWPT